MGKIHHEGKVQVSSISSHVWPEINGNLNSAFPLRDMANGMLGPKKTSFDNHGPLPTLLLDGDGVGWYTLRPCMAGRTIVLMWSKKS